MGAIVTSGFIFLISFVTIMVGAILGLLLRTRLPETHLGSESKEVIRLGTGLIGTLAALVIGLMIASAKSSYDMQNTNVRQLTANLILTDQLLAQYGPETREIRGLLRGGVGTVADRIWHKNAAAPPQSATFSASSIAEQFYGAIEALSPGNDLQRSLKPRIVQASADFARTRLLIFASGDNPILMPFLLILIVWLTVIFASFSLFAEPAVVVLTAMVIFALSVSSSLFLIMDLSQPFAGVMQISSEQFQHALAPLGS
jgi:hypothetical protein